MPFDPNAFIEAISNAIPKVPSALIAAALLGGPTAIWLIVRFTRPPDVPKVVEVPETLLWLCTSCRSMNEDRVNRCYRCHQPREADDIPVVVHVGREAASRIGIPVGHGITGQGPSTGWLGGEFVVPPVLTKEKPEPKKGKTAPAAVAAPAVVAAPAATAAPPAAAPAPVPAPDRSPAAVERSVVTAPDDFVSIIETPIEPVILEPKVKVSGRKSAPGPARQRGRRKPQGAGEANSKRNTSSPGS